MRCHRYRPWPQLSRQASRYSHQPQTEIVCDRDVAHRLVQTIWSFGQAPVAAMAGRAGGDQPGLLES